MKTPAHPNHSGKIFVVDDDAGIRDGFQAILETEGYNVKAFPDADILLSLVKDDRPDLIILDVLLSGKDGREVCGLLKKNPKTHPIPIIMVSAHLNAEHSVKACGADAFLQKPFELDELLQTVSQYIPHQ